MSASTETTRDLGHERRGLITIDKALLNEMKAALGVGVIGLPVIFAGAIAFFFRIKLAELFLGAHVWFNVPLTDADNLKILVVTFHILGFIGWGVVMTAVGVFFTLFKWMQLQNDARIQQ